MQVKNISLCGFRNLREQEVDLSDGLNLFFGENGQGKTNFLEAVYLVATLRSFRGASVRDVVSFDHEEAEISAVVENRGVPLRLRVCLTGSSRRLWVGSRAVHSVGEFLGQLKVVAFTPDDLSMIKGGPAVRRRFLDRAAFLFEPQHLVNVKNFNHALKNRNRVLRDKGSGYLDVADSFGQAMALEGNRVSRTRKKIIGPVGKRAEEILGRLIPESTGTRIEFKPGWEMSDGDGHRELLEQIRACTDRDARRGQTSLGPQQDDFEITMGEGSARRFASQGQQRTAAVALLLAVVYEIVETGGDRPVILLDDVSSELDETRRSLLFGKLDELGGQTLVTTTDPAIVDGIVGRRVARYRVESGEITTCGGG